MAESSKIAWTRSTFNPWSTPALTLGVKWGAGQPRRRTSAANWRQPLKWDAEAARTGEFWPVFCSSLADVFDNEVDPEWRADLFMLMEGTPNLTWLVLTKRIGNVRGMLPALWTGEFGGRKALGIPPNIWLGATIVNQEEADRDIPKLLAVPVAKRFVSYEPALGPVDFTKVCDRSSRRALWINSIEAREANPAHASLVAALGENYPYTRLDWIIIGGESDQPGMRARPFNIAWARSTVRQCRAAGVPVFVKQLGSAVVVRNDSMGEWPDQDAFSDAIPDDYQPQHQGEEVCLRLRDRAGADPAEWPEDLRVQEFPK